MRSDAGTSHVAGQWRKLSPSAELTVDPGRGARCAIRDTGAPGGGRYHWTIRVFCEPDPVAAGRTGKLAEARSRADEALHACAENGGLARLAFARMATRLAGLHVGAFWDPDDPALISFPGPAWLNAG
jgi:hypothetical protein